MRACEHCGSALDGDVCRSCGMVVSRGMRTQPCVRWIGAANAGACDAARDDKRIASLIADSGCPMDASCPKFEKNPAASPFEERIAAIASGRKYPFADEHLLDRAMALVALRTGTEEEQFSDGHWIAVAHVYDAMQRYGQGLFETLKHVIDYRFVDEWCVFLDKQGRCLQPMFVDDEMDISADKEPKMVDFGPCPYKGDWVAQSKCDIAVRDPRLDERSKRGSAETMLVHAAWNDVRSKAVRLRKEGRVSLVRHDKNIIAARVRGDHGVYNTVIYRQEAEDKYSVTTWECTCPWGQWAFKRKFLFGRMCSHAYATLMEAQSQLMRGPGSDLWQQKVAAERYSVFCREDGMLIERAASLIPQDGAWVIEADSGASGRGRSIEAAIEELRRSLAENGNEVIAVAPDNRERCSVGECDSCASTEDLSIDPETGMPICGACRTALLEEAVMLVRSGSASPAVYMTLEAFLGDGMHEFILEYAPSSSAVLDGKCVDVLGWAAGGRIAHVLVDGEQMVVDASALVPVERQEPLKDIIMKKAVGMLGFMPDSIEGRLVNASPMCISGAFICGGDRMEYRYLFDGRLIIHDERTASRQFSYIEEQELLHEGDGALPRNIDLIKADDAPFVRLNDISDESLFL